MVTIRGETVELEPGLTVRKSTWDALQTLGSLPEFGVPFLSRVAQSFGSWTEAARWLDTYTDRFGRSPADYINSGRQDIASELLNEYEAKQ